MNEIDSKLKAIGRENPEPEEGRNPWPYAVWLFFGIMIGWGVTYMALLAGSGDMMGGDRRTLIAAEPSTSSVAPSADGAKIYRNVCMACHQQTGVGVAGAFPPLAGSEWVNGDAKIPAKIILHGLQGAIEVKGATYNGVMPAFGEQLKDEEIAAVVSYVRSQWGNSASPLSAGEVTELREKLKDRTTPWSAGELKN